jgi:twinkle protein
LSPAIRGHGKTQLWTQIWFNVVRAYCIPIAVASFETRAKPHIQRYLRTLLTGKLEKNMDEEEKRKADAFIEDRYLFMVHPDGRPSLKWFLDMAEVAVVRHGARIIQVDPWNRLEAARAGTRAKPNTSACACGKSIRSPTT